MGTYGHAQNCRRDYSFFGENKQLPDSVDDVIANLAVVFHWTPADCDSFSLEELMAWEDRARKRTEAE
ncbi:GpE family phage tail protein [Acinetobacter baumannii]|uniref:GpE family phage tail protein n=1 Tax=Acinetobacter baumannii TaxID=470 RepID=UPI00280C7457|nr:GpE family phage tail protein [Acinetobacter baumannii]MDQ9001562.1 GpE family phage tail protein [Acinetobacter baumannii]